VGGDLDWMAKPEKDFPLAQKLYALDKVGAVAPEVIETEYGFHVLKYTGTRTPEDAVREIQGNTKLDQFLTQMSQERRAQGRFNEAALRADLPKTAVPEPKKP
jgi:parvulin-like peptidyl-prolyl isomerase